MAARSARPVVAVALCAAFAGALRLPVESSPPSLVPSRRRLLALAPLLAGSGVHPAAALLGLGEAEQRPRVDLVETPEICQGRCRSQDFVVVRYVGRRADGTVFDDRYAERPLVYELGSFYLPGVDQGIEGGCVGSRFKMSWARSPDLGSAYATLLPPGTPIEIEIELLSIRYSLFGEKMRNASDTYWFAEAPLTLTSAADYRRGHASNRAPVVTKDNPFSIAPGEKSIISNPSSVIGPLFSGFFEKSS